jgi:hypothetical protein
MVNASLTSTTVSLVFQLSKQTLIGLLAGGVVLAAATTGSLAAPVLSGDGTETCAYVSPLLGSGPCTVQIVTAHPLWQSDALLPVPAKWISYGPTGYQDAGPVAPFDFVNPLIRITEVFNVVNTMVLNILVWADDTAEVFIDGVSIYAPNFSQNICANGTIGCEPNEAGVITHTLNAGLHTLDFDVYQIGTGTTTASNPFGILYFGSIDASGGGSSVDEAGTLALLATSLGLVGIGALRRRKRA